MAVPASTIKPFARGGTSITRCHSQRRRAHERTVCPSRQLFKPLAQLWLRHEILEQPEPQAAVPNYGRKRVMALQRVDLAAFMERMVVMAPMVPTSTMFTFPSTFIIRKSLAAASGVLSAGVSPTLSASRLPGPGGRAGSLR
jgi:hypothetical protein